MINDDSIISLTKYRYISLSYIEEKTLNLQDFIGVGIFCGVSRFGSWEIWCIIFPHFVFFFKIMIPKFYKLCSDAYLCLESLKNCFQNNKHRQGKI